MLLLKVNSAWCLEISFSKKNTLFSPEQHLPAPVLERIDPDIK
jgi:hypothetical protein